MGNTKRNPGKTTQDTQTRLKNNLAKLLGMVNQSSEGLYAAKMHDDGWLTTAEVTEQTGGKDLRQTVYKRLMKLLKEKKIESCKTGRTVWWRPK